MKKNLSITLIFIFTFFSIFTSSSQNMVGLIKTEVQKQMELNFPKFSPSSFGISTNMNTLKYVDSKTDRTLIFYFTMINEEKFLII